MKDKVLKKETSWLDDSRIKNFQNLQKVDCQYWQNIALQCKHSVYFHVIAHNVFLDIVFRLKCHYYFLKYTVSRFITRINLLYITL